MDKCNKCNRYHCQGRQIWRNLCPPGYCFEFASWISAEFKLYLLKEFQRLKQIEVEQKQLEWNVSRTLAKVNYLIHTDAIKENLIPENISKSKRKFVYADEADLLNIALFGKTAKE
jgi:hypothetical protein